MTKVTYTLEVETNRADGLSRKQTIEVIALIDKEVLEDCVSKEVVIEEAEVWVHRHNKDGRVIASQEIVSLLEALGVLDKILVDIDWKALAAEQKADKQLQDI